MAKALWAPHELEVLERHVANDDWLESIVSIFPNRSISSLKTRMSKLRSELGIRGKRGAREDCQERFNAKAIDASKRLLEATLRVGRWS